MSRGLGKIEKDIMKIVTYPNVESWINIREIISILDDEWYENDIEVKGMSVNQKIKHFCVHDDKPYLYCRWPLQKSLTKEGKVFYQSLMRAIRSLERKGFIESQIEDMGLSDSQKEEIKEDLKEAPMTKEIRFNNKCLINGIPWRLKYLN